MSFSVNENESNGQTKNSNVEFQLTQTKLADTKQNSEFNLNYSLSHQENLVKQIKEQLQQNKEKVAQNENNSMLMNITENYNNLNQIPNNTVGSNITEQLQSFQQNEFSDDFEDFEDSIKEEFMEDFAEEE